MEAQGRCCVCVWVSQMLITALSKQEFKNYLVEMACQEMLMPYF